MTNRCFILLGLLFLAPACSSPETHRGERVAIESPRVHRNGDGIITVRLPVVVSDSYHVQANPASEKYLIPTQLEIAPSPGMNLEEIVYPEGKSFVLEGNPNTIAVYDRRFEIMARYIVVDRTVDPEKLSLSGTLTYQACDHKSCFPPASVPFELVAPVEGNVHEAALAPMSSAVMR